MITRITASWQLILADLALILFLVTLAALASANEEEKNERSVALTTETSVPIQALYRPVEGIIPFSVWLDDQSNDPRAQLTIYAIYTAANQDEIWQQVREMASDATKRDMATKVVMTQGESGEIYAKIAFDRSAHSDSNREQ